MTAKSKKLMHLGIAGGTLALVLCVLLLLRNVSTAFSDWFTVNVTQWLVWAPAHFNALLPFSVFEIIVILLILGVVALIVLLILALVKKKYFAIFRGLLIVAIVGLSVGGTYTLTAGFAYNRSPVPVPVTEKEYTNDETVAATEYFLADYNALAEKLPRDEKGNVIPPYGLAALSDLIANEYAKLGDYFFAYSPRAKGMLNSWFMTLTSITGITFLPFGEPVINKDMPASDLPQTVAHEMAHAKGVMREGDCNFVAYYVLLSSSNDYLRYCGYFSIFGHLLGAVDQGQSDKSNYLRLSDAISPVIRTEQLNAFTFWTEKTSQGGAVGFFARLFDDMGRFFNNLYLKLSGAENGTGSYDDTVGDGSITDTGETDPDTGEPIYKVTYSSVQKMFFALYESK